jgi:hypothetical protein
VTPQVSADIFQPRRTAMPIRRKEATLNTTDSHRDRQSRLDASRASPGPSRAVSTP